MIVLDHDQGSTEWIEARLGIPTASGFHRIITPTGKLSASRDAYEGELLAEWALGRPVTEFGGNDWTERERRWNRTPAPATPSTPTASRRPWASRYGTRTACAERRPTLLWVSTGYWS